MLHMVPVCIIVGFCSAEVWQQALIAPTRVFDEPRSLVVVESSSLSPHGIVDTAGA